jgi:HAMP domain-containing protein
MSDPNEIGALKASIRGVVQSLQDLRPLAERVDAIDPANDVTDTDLDDLQRLSASHAVAAEALRGLVRTMLKRRGRLMEAATIKTGGEE